MRTNGRIAVNAQTALASVPEFVAADGQQPFAFVQALAAELSGGKVDLPGFPEIVARVRQALADENASADKIARVIGAEPVLAARLLQMANSVALNLSGRQVIDLRTAVMRVGLNVVRSAVIAYAVRQLSMAPMLNGLEKPLDALWQRSVLVASLCYVLARRCTQVNPDAALLAGLLHGIGRLYILTRASRHRALFTDVATYQAIERDWHLSVATALLENWEFADEIVHAVRDSEDFTRESRGPIGLSDVLITATVIAVHQDSPEMLEARLQNVKPAARLQLDRAQRAALMEESAQEIAALREALY